MYNEPKLHDFFSQDADKCGSSARETFIPCELLLSVPEMLLFQRQSSLETERKDAEANPSLPMETPFSPYYCLIISYSFLTYLCPQILIPSLL